MLPSSPSIAFKGDNPEKRRKTCQLNIKQLNDVINLSYFSIDVKLLWQPSSSPFLTGGRFCSHQSCLQRKIYCLKRCHLHPQLLLQFYCIEGRQSWKEEKYLSTFNIKTLERCNKLILFYWSWQYSSSPSPSREANIICTNTSIRIRIIALETCFTPCLAMTWIMTTMLLLLCCAFDVAFLRQLPFKKWFCRKASVMHLIETTIVHC